MDLMQSSQAVTSSIPKKGDRILQNAIDSFRTVLTPEQLAEFECIQSVPDTDALLVFTAELDLRRQNQKGKSIASRLFPVLQAVHSFTSVIDTYVSSNPTIAALVWGSVKMTMMIMLNAAPYYEAFVELCMELGRICPRFEQHQALFPASERLQSALCTFDASIIQCCQRVIAMPKSSSGWTSPLNPLNPSFWQSFQQAFESDLQKLRDHSKNVNKEVRLAADQSQHRNNELQRLENEQADWSRRSLSRFMSRTRDDFDTMHRLQIMRSEELEMGSGKSIICASVIDYLLTKRSSSQSHVTFFFSRFDDSESMRAETILRALTRQLVATQDLSDDTKQALESIQHESKRVSSELSGLLTHLLCRKGPPSWVIVDGIDECQREERQALIKVLRSILDADVNARLFITSRDHANLIFKGANVNLEQISMNCSLAQHVEIKNTLAKHADGMILWVTLVLRHLCSQPNNESIRAAIAFKNIPRKLTDIFNRILDRTISDEKDNIVQALLPWIVAAKQPLTLSQLQECCLISPLQEYTIRDRYVNGIHVIDTWFHGLIEIDYETKTVHLIHACVQQFFLAAPEKPALSNFHVRIQDSDRHIGDICITYLNFNDFKTTLARVRLPLRPIAPAEICQKALSKEWSWPKLLKLSQRIHGHRRRAADIDGTIASYTRAPHTTAQETIIANHPFLEYASAHWLSHSVLFDQGQCKTWNLWKAMVMCGHELAASPVSEEHHRTSDEALVLWATYNRHSALLHIIATSMGLREKYEKTVFDYVIQEGDVNLLHRILNADRWNFKLTLLFCRAVRSGRLELVKTIFETGVSSGGHEGLSYYSPSEYLTEATVHGHINVMEYLIQKGADPNSVSKFHSSPLELAAKLGGSEGLQACRLLFDAGATMRNTNALLISCARGDGGIIKFLLSAGADINASYPTPPWTLPSNDGTFVYQDNTALLQAFSVQEPEVDIIDILIGAGAKINIGSSEDSGYRLLRLAIRGHDCNLVKILIREGADPSGRRGLYAADTPLGLAADDGLFQIMRYLLDKGARVVGFKRIAAIIPSDVRNGKDYEEVLAALKQADQK
ncbi:hypothetical protein FBULB1_1837 [Fusarium bulbicola]|nr:hypothetical protein FBULB1_1837 [Fusarium bulbicola]